MLQRLLLVLWILNAFGAENVTHPFLGVTHIHRTESEPRRFNLHVLRIALDAPGIRIQLSGPGGTREAVRRTPLEFLEESGAQIAVNAHFFTPYPSEELDSFLIGLAAADGVVYSDFETPEQSYALVASAPAVHVDKDGLASLVRPGYTGKLWTAVAGSAQVITSGAVTIPLYRDDAHPEGVLTPGGPGKYSNAKSWYETPNARTFIGLSQDRRLLFLATVDKAEGLTVTEAARLLAREYGVHDALNLDGGGSTALVMRNAASGKGEVVNVPAGGVLRRVASSLAVFARPAPKD